MREIVYRLDVGHNFLKIDASENFYLRPNGDDTQKVFMLPQSYTINCRRLLLRESSLNPQWFLDLLFYVDESDIRKDSDILDEFFKFSSYDVAFDSDNVSSSGQNVFVSGVNGEAPYFADILNKVTSVDERIRVNNSYLNILGNQLMARDVNEKLPFTEITSLEVWRNFLYTLCIDIAAFHPLEGVRIKQDSGTEMIRFGYSRNYETVYSNYQKSQNFRSLQVVQLFLEPAWLAFYTLNSDEVSLYSDASRTPRIGFKSWNHPVSMFCVYYANTTDDVDILNNFPVALWIDSRSELCYDLRDVTVNGTNYRDVPHIICDNPLSLGTQLRNDLILRKTFIKYRLKQSM